MSNHPEIMTLEQAANYLQITVEELMNEIEFGHILSTTIAGKIRIRRIHLDQLFDFGSKTTNNSTSKHENADLLESAIDPQTTEQQEFTATDKTVSHGSSSAQSINDEALASKSNELEQSPQAHNQATEELPPIQPGCVRGRVFSYNPKQGFGYIRLLDNRAIWLDSSQLVDKSRTPLPGDLLEFELIIKKKILQATNVRLIQKYDWITHTSVSVPQVRQANTSPQIASVRVDDANPLGFLDSMHNLPARHNPSTATFLASSLYQKAALARTEGQYDAALQYFRQAIAAGASLQIYSSYLKFLIERGYRREAVRVFAEAIQRYPDQSVFYDMYGHMERRARNYEGAERIFRAGIKNVPLLSSNVNLRNGLAQTLVTIGTEASLTEAGKLYTALKKEGKLNESDRIYQNYRTFARNARAIRVIDFFQKTGYKVRVAGQKDVVPYASDIVVEMENPEFRESFGLSGAFLVRCFTAKPSQIDLRDLGALIRRQGDQGSIGLRDGSQVVINSTVAFIAVNDTDSVKDQVMNILSLNNEAIIPLDDADMTSQNDPVQILRDLFGQYLGQRDLYASTVPVSGRKFFGREQLLIKLTDEIESGQFLGIFGLRKMGKTSLVYQLRDKKLSDEAVAYVDLQASSAIQEGTCNPLYYELERDLYVRLAEKGLNDQINQILRIGKALRYSDLPEKNENLAIYFSEDMKLLLQEIADGNLGDITQLVFVLDELERLLPMGNQPAVKGYLDFFGILRGLAQSERYRGLLSCVVVAANASISERGYWENRENPVFALFKPIFLPPLSKDEFKEMIVSLGKGMSVYWDQTAIDKVYFETAGHPFLTRAFCSRIIRNHIIRPLTVTEEMVSLEINNFVREDGDKLGQITELLQRNFPEEEDYLQKIAIGEDISRISDESLKHLIGYGLIRQNEDGCYEVTLNLLRRFLRRLGGYRDEQ